MVSVCVHQVDNLPPPWGNCTTEKPKYYPEFTVSACQMDCENDLAREMCQCRDINMPKAGEGRWPEYNMFKPGAGMWKNIG